MNDGLGVKMSPRLPDEDCPRPAGPAAVTTTPVGARSSGPAAAAQDWVVLHTCPRTKEALRQQEELPTPSMPSPPVTTMLSAAAQDKVKKTKAGEPSWIHSPSVHRKGETTELSSALTSIVDDFQGLLTSTLANHQDAAEVDKGAWDVARRTEEINFKPFPTLFQQGVGAQQLKQVYHQFFPPGEETASPAVLVRPSTSSLRLEELAGKLPSFGNERLSLLLDLLTSRSLLQRTAVADHFMWHLPIA
eukprot:SM000102S09180  [mRNA]  locus=s102:71038:72439:- [translate_table: standard]